MKTDELISMLSANVETVDPHQFRRVFVLAVWQPGEKPGQGQGEVAGIV